MKAIALAQTLISLQNILKQNPIVKNPDSIFAMDSNTEYQHKICVKEGASKAEISQLLLDVQSFGFQVSTESLPTSFTFSMKYKPISMDREVRIYRLYSPFYRGGIKQTHMILVGPANDRVQWTARYAPDLLTALFKSRPAHVAKIKLTKSEPHDGLQLVHFSPAVMIISRPRFFTDEDLKSVRSSNLEHNPLA